MGSCSCRAVRCSRSIIRVVGRENIEAAGQVPNGATGVPEDDKPTQRGPAFGAAKRAFLRGERFEQVGMQPIGRAGGTTSFSGRAC